MSLDFLQDAFRKLNEAAFDTSVDSLDKLDAFMENSDEKADTSINVIDTDADTEDELSDSYVGKVICECPICHSYVFRKKGDIDYDEDASLANTTDECPYCCEVGGMKIVGQVAPYIHGDEDEKDNDAEENSDEESSAEEEDEVPEESETESEEIPDEAPVDEAKEAPEKQPIEENVAEQECVPAKRIFAGFEGTEDEFTQALNDCLGESMWESVELDDEDENAPCEVYCGGKLVGKFLFADNGFYNVDTNECFTKKAESCKNCDDDANELKEMNIDQETGESLESLSEGVSVEVSTDSGNAVSVDEDGKVAIENAAVTAETDGDSIVIKAKESAEMASDEETSTAHDGEEVVAPVTPDELVAEEDETDSKEEEPVEEEGEAAPEPADITSDEDASQDDAVKEEGFNSIVDRPMTNLDTESFDRIGEKYLTSIYENVESFKTTDVFADDSKLKIEGLINFKSGKSSKTAFVFEAKDITKSGKARFVGTNESICRGKRAFTLTGTLSDGNYITESLNYNYTARTPSNRSVKVTGTINNK